MEYEINKGILELLFRELISELSTESMKRIAEKIAAAIRINQVCHESHVRKLLDIDDLEKQADLANMHGNLGQALRKQIAAEEIRFSL